MAIDYCMIKQNDILLWGLINSSEKRRYGIKTCCFVLTGVLVKVHGAHARNNVRLNSRCLVIYYIREPLLEGGVIWKDQSPYHPGSHSRSRQAHAVSVEYATQIFTTKTTLSNLT